MDMDIDPGSPFQLDPDADLPPTGEPPPHEHEYDPEGTGTPKACWLCGEAPPAAPLCHYADALGCSNQAAYELHTLGKNRKIARICREHIATAAQDFARDLQEGTPQ